MDQDDQKELEKLRKIVAQWTETLEWYSDRSNYRGEPRLVSSVAIQPGGSKEVHQVWTTPEIKLDKGRRAELALRMVKK